ncbi:MAG: hypothetical protein ABI859_03820 [Pseudomonadota bacterium]
MNGGVWQGSGAPANPRLWLQVRPAQRLLVQGVMALTAQLVRSLGQGSNAAALQELVAERQRLLRELGRGIRGERELGCYEAMLSAVVESDAAIEVMLNGKAA